jgi:AdoMet-dependent heme synthase
VTGGFDALHATAVVRCIPLTTHLEVTYRCNARCVHCFQDRGAAPRELSTDEWITVVNQVRAAGALILTLSGGEALLSSSFWPVAEHARRIGLAVRVFTNGLLLTRANVARLRALRPLSVEVSIFSLRPERHDAVTKVPGSLARALRGLFRGKRAGIPLVIKCPLLSVSGDDYAEVRALAERLGASVVFEPHIFPRSDGHMAPTRCRGDDATLGSYFADPVTQGYDRRTLLQVAPECHPCGMARTFLVVSPEGELLPCPVLQASAGNVRRERLDVLWREAPLLQRLRSRTFGALRGCGTCPRSGYCDRCSAMALLEDGDLDGPSSRACHIAELRERAWGLPAPAGAPTPPNPLLRVVE